MGNANTQDTQNKGALNPSPHLINWALNEGEHNFTHADSEYWDKNKEPHPYIQYYASDKVLLKLELDVEKRYRSSLRNGFIHTCFTCGLDGGACYLCFFAKGQTQRVADAHHLTLREKTLLFERDEHTISMETSEYCICAPGGPCGNECRLQESVYQINQDGARECNCSRKVDSKTMVIRLEDLQLIGSYRTPGGLDCIEGVDFNPQKLVIYGKDNHSEKVVIDYPKYVNDFIQAVEDQRAKVIADDLDPNPPEDPLLKAQAKALAGFGGAMGMGINAPNSQEMERPNKNTAGSAGVTPSQTMAERLRDLKQLKDDGILTELEFDKKKADILNET